MMRYCMYICMRPNIRNAEVMGKIYFFTDLWDSEHCSDMGAMVTNSDQEIKQLASRATLINGCLKSALEQ